MGNKLSTALVVCCSVLFIPNAHSIGRYDEAVIDAENPEVIFSASYRPDLSVSRREKPQNNLEHIVVNVQYVNGYKKSAIVRSADGKFIVRPLRREERVWFSIHGDNAMRFTKVGDVEFVK